MWLGYGSYSGVGVHGPINPGNIRADPGIFYRLFGLKEKSKAENEEDSEEVRRPNW